MQHLWLPVSPPAHQTPSEKEMDTSYIGPYVKAHQESFTIVLVTLLCLP